MFNILLTQDLINCMDQGQPKKSSLKQLKVAIWNFTIHKVEIQGIITDNNTRE